MSRLLRKITTKKIPGGATIVNVKPGDRVAKWTDKRGKARTAFLNKKGTRVVVYSKKWWGEWEDADGVVRTEKLATNKDAAQMMLNERVRAAEMGKARIRNPCGAHDKRPLREHLEDYRRELEARNRDPRYVELTVSRIRALLDGCKFVFTSDLSASRAMDWLASLREQGRKRVALEPGKELFTKKELAEILGVTPSAIPPHIRRYRLAAVGNGKARKFPRATVEALQDRLCRGAGATTSNQYLSAVKSFVRWMVKDKRTGSNPLEHLDPINENVDRRHDRRELTGTELQSLLAAAKVSTHTRLGLTGADRFTLYAAACGTGFRAAGLASLTPESFDLNHESPTVTIAARKNKSRVMRVQPIPPDVADLLRDYLKGKRAGKPVWGGPWASARRAADLLRTDLADAGIPYSVEGPDGPLYADFHALRHSYITALRRGGVDLRTAQELAGHSSPVLTARYSHTRLHDLTGAVEKLPKFLPGDPPSGMKATGTEGK